MASLGPNCFSTGAADNIAWAQLFFWRCFRCHEVGPLFLGGCHYISSSCCRWHRLGPILFWGVLLIGPLHSLQLPQVTLLRPIIVFGGAAALEIWIGSRTYVVHSSSYQVLPSAPIYLIA